MAKIIAIAGTKGGTTKTTTAHLICLGAALTGRIAAYVLTDPYRQLRDSGRPYAVLDGREPANLASIITASRGVADLILVIDGGGNRPAFDMELSGAADLTLIPFRPSEEDIATAAEDMRTITGAFAWPCAWPQNVFARRAAQFYKEAMIQAFPDRIIKQPLDFVNSVADLLADNLETPTGATRKAAKKAIATVLPLLL
jgi:chromosome partitioning protein